MLRYVDWKTKYMIKASNKTGHSSVLEEFTSELHNKRFFPL